MINWGMAYPQQNALANLGQNVAYGYQLGRQRAAERQAEEGRNALAAYAANPTREGAAGLVAYNPQFGMSEVGRFDQQAAAATANQRDQLPTITRLLEGATAENWQQRRAMAQQYGMDVSQVPAQFDPAWVQSTSLLVQAMQSPEGQQEISGIARELVNAGYEMGTPAFEQAMRGVINNKYASEYVDEYGNTRRRSALDLAPPPAADPNPPPSNTTGRAQSVDVSGFNRVRSRGDAFAVRWAIENNVAVQVASPAEARQLPSGTPILLPDGTVGSVP